MKFLCVLFAVFAVVCAKPGLLVETDAPAEVVHAKHVEVASPVLTYSAPAVYSFPYNHVIQSNEPTPVVKTVAVHGAPLVYSSPVVSISHT